MATNQSGKPTQLLITYVVSGTSVPVDAISDETSVWFGYPKSFQVDLNITPQTHGDATTNTPFYYGAGDVEAGDWLLQPSGKAYRIGSVISRDGDGFAQVIIEDVDSYIILGDSSGSGNNYPDEEQSGVCIELDADGMPIVAGIAQLSASLPNIGYWIDDATARFEASGSGAGAAQAVGINTNADLNKRSVVTTANGDSTEISITYTPFSDSSVAIKVNGMEVNLGDGVKTEDSYLSNDGGVTAKLMADIEAGDILFWNGLVAGYQLDGTDDIDISYQKSSLD
jgi:hypothetical protein